MNADVYNGLICVNLRNLRIHKDSSPPIAKNHSEEIMRSITRRELIGGAAALPLILTTARAQDKQIPGLIIREKEPENLEFPFSSLNSFITPNDRFYIRSHFKVPALDARSWRLKVEGHVEREIDLTYDDLRAMPTRSLPATLECAGNSRVFLTPTVRGAQWELGGVSTAEWTGVPLGAVLAKAGLKPGAVDIVLEGADSGSIKDEPKPPDAIHFARSLPVSKATDRDTILAFRMNGSDLPVSHGFPLRTVVPGWYGVASIKWLARIIVMDRPFQGHFQTVDYAYWERRNGIPTRIPITEMLVKSAISRPNMHEAIPTGTAYRVHGAAWTADGDIQRVELSTDSGATWSASKLLGRPVAHSWRMWEYDWKVPSSPGRYTLMSRATDTGGRTQPDKRDPDRANYLINHTLPIDVEVR
jgi:DMSO/TMAO reductase YedYZ molybdopterin-dependent catalytic subunit